MKSIKFLSLLIPGVPLTFSCEVTKAENDIQKKPNIVVIMADDLATNELSLPTRVFCWEIIMPLQQ